VIRTYEELIKRDTFLARFRYAVLGGQLGVATFGYERPLNQTFYASREWKRTRDLVIIRDNGCDLGVRENPIMDRVLVHHMNPIMVSDLTEFNPALLELEYLICVSTRTHNAIHFGDESQLPSPIVERMPGDTKDW
jgi:hypothetical protein